MMGNQMTNLSFLGGNSSPCSEGMGWGRHQVPDSAQPGRAVCTAGSARPHLLPGGPEGGLAAIGPAGVTLCIQGLAQAGAGRAPGATLRRAGGREQPRNCTSFGSDSRPLCGTDRSTGRAGPPALPRGVSFTWHLFVHSAMSHRGLLRAEHTSNARTISGPTPVTAESAPGLAALAQASPAGRSPESARGFLPCWQGLQASEPNRLTCLMDPGAGAPQNHGPQVPCHTGGLMSDPASARKLGTAAAVRSRSSVGFPGSLLPSRVTRTCQSDAVRAPFASRSSRTARAPTANHARPLLPVSPQHPPQPPTPRPVPTLGWQEGLLGEMRAEPGARAQHSDGKKPSADR